MGRRVAHGCRAARAIGRRAGERRSPRAAHRGRSRAADAPFPRVPGERGVGASGATGADRARHGGPRRSVSGAGRALRARDRARGQGDPDQGRRLVGHGWGSRSRSSGAARSRVRFRGRRSGQARAVDDPLRFFDQDFFEADPVRYRAALGEAGLAEFRSLLAAQGDQDGFAARYARERLPVLDGDSAAIVALLGGDLTRPHQFIRVAEAMVELSRDEEAVAWARRGIEQTTGRPISCMTSPAWPTPEISSVLLRPHRLPSTCWRDLAGTLQRARRWSIG